VGAPIRAGPGGILLARTPRIGHDGGPDPSEATTMPAPDLKSIFAEALGRPPGPGRAAYLDGACRGDAALRAEVEALLRDAERLGGFLASAHDGARHVVTVSLEPGSSSALAELAESLGGLPRVLLRDPDATGPASGPVARAASPQMPGPGDRTGRYQLFG